MVAEIKECLHHQGWKYYMTFMYDEFGHVQHVNVSKHYPSHLFQ